jgi:hypothetical protein
MNTEVLLEDVMGRISTGKAILFTGAGFSIGMKNSKGEEPPRASDLSSLISQLGDFEDDGDLRYVADYYIEKCDRSKLVNLLRSRYTLVEAGESQRTICRATWRRIYTTNYDNSIELAASIVRQTDNFIESITLAMEPKEYAKRDNLCIHINGSINFLNEAALGSSFKLSDSSYLADSFIESAWYRTFKSDLERCSAIVFVGYSLYDIEIQKILFTNPTFKEKTFFIVAENNTTKLEFTLSKFGNILPIGIENFANYLSSYLEQEQHSEVNEQSYEAFEQYSLLDQYKPISDSEINRFLLNGDLERCHIDNAISSIQTLPCLIVRDSLEKVYSFLRESHHVVIISEFGNGKTIFARELMSYLTISGKKLFYLYDSEGKYCDDLDRFSRLSSEIFLIIEDYEKYLDIINYFGQLNPTNIRLILTARTKDHDRSRKKLQDCGLRPYEVHIDELTNKEVLQFIEIIDNASFWGELANYSSQRKHRIITRECRGQISLTLLKLFDAPQIKNRISAITREIFSEIALKDTAFAICLLEVLGLPLTFSLISDVSNRNDIYTTQLALNSHFQEFFPLSPEQVKSKSPILSMSLLRNHFSPSYIVEKLLEIAEKCNDNKADSVSERLLNSLLRFSSVENIFPDSGKKSSLRNYYQGLKIKLTWLKTNPHYWLQYGMAELTFNEYEEAQKYLNTAYSLAKNKINYDTSYIDVQQARIYLKKALYRSDVATSFQFFSDAHRLLTSVENNIYKFRQVCDAYKMVFDEIFQDYKPGQRATFEHSCKRMANDLEQAKHRGDVDVHDRKVKVTQEQLAQILDSIRLLREKDLK